MVRTSSTSSGGEWPEDVGTYFSVLCIDTGVHWPERRRLMLARSLDLRFEAKPRTASAVRRDKAHGQPRAGCFGVAAQRGEGRRHPPALQPRDRGLGRAEPSGKLRLRQLRRGAGADQRLVEGVRSGETRGARTKAVERIVQRRRDDMVRVREEAAVYVLRGSGCSGRHSGGARRRGVFSVSRRSRNLQSDRLVVTSVGVMYCSCAP